MAIALRRTASALFFSIYFNPLGFQLILPVRSVLGQVVFGLHEEECGSESGDLLVLVDSANHTRQRAVADEHRAQMDDVKLSRSYHRFQPEAKQKGERPVSQNQDDETQGVQCATLAGGAGGRGICS